MQTKGFLGSLFDFSFTSFITGKIIKVLFALSVILNALWTLGFILFAFKASSAFGVLTLLILGPLFFLIATAYTRVILEVLMVLFRINENVGEIANRPPASAPEPPPAAAAAEPVPAV